MIFGNYFLNKTMVKELFINLLFPVLCTLLVYTDLT